MHHCFLIHITFILVYTVFDSNDIVTVVDCVTDGLPQRSQSPPLFRPGEPVPMGANPWSPLFFIIIIIYYQGLGIIIIIKYLYSAIMSKDMEALGGTGLREVLL